MNGQIMERRFFLKTSFLGSLSVCGLPYLTQARVAKPAEWQGKKILFLGDSITQAGSYINFLESSLLAASAGVNTGMLNLGLASETISGLSEDAHPFPRPYVHDRLAEVLSHTRPDIIFACYGINCGIYHPFDEDIFRAYRQGIAQLLKAAEAQQAELILMTPPPYAAPVDDWTAARADSGRSDFSYAKPYLAYDDVMKRYAEWIMSLEDKVQVIDLQSPMRQFQALCYDNDFIHPNLYGHQLMAVTILRKLDWVVNKPIELHLTPYEKPGNDPFGHYLTTSLPRLPFRIHTDDPDYNLLIAGHDVNLMLQECPAGTYQLFDQHLLVGQYDAAELRYGITLHNSKQGEQLNQLSPWQQSKQLYDLITAKRSLYDYSLLQHIGHERPMSRQGLPMKLAETKKREIQAQMLDLLSAPAWKLNLVKLS